MIEQDTKGWNDLSELESYIPEKPVVGGKSILICDGNNLGYRYLQRRNYNNFKDDYCRTVESLAKSYGCKDILVAFDFGKSYYRTTMYPEYKATRKKPQDEKEKEHYDQFFACLNDVADSIPFAVAKFRGVEADDLITHAVLKNRESADHIWIISSDRDIYQLLDKNVSIFNIFSRKEITVASLQEKLQVTPKEYMISRIISGDDGDNIIGIEGIGEKRATALAREHKTFSGLLEALPIKGRSKYIQNLNQGREILIRNEKLINLVKYNEEAILSGKGEEITLEELNAITTFNH